MTGLLPGIVADPAGATASVQITSATAGTTPTVYSDPWGVNPVSLPATITTPTVFYLPNPGRWTVNGTTVTLEDAEVATVNLSGGYVIATNSAADTYASTVTFDLSKSPTHFVTLAGNPTLAVVNDNLTPRFTVVLYTGAGSFTVTWWAGIRWAAGTAPTITATAAKYDVFTFIRVSTGVYLGFIVGQAL